MKKYLGICFFGAIAAVAACSDDDDMGTTPVADAGTSAPDSGNVATTDAATDTGAVTPAATNVVYVQSNDPREGQNSILAYARQTDGSLAPIAGSPFLTGGRGVSNAKQVLGPDDSDNELIATPDHKRLYSVNAGSNTIAVFDIASDGALSPIAGSPFPSGGINPVSLGLAGDVLFVVHQDLDEEQDAAAGAPKYSALRVAADGSLTTLPASTAAGASPQMALVSRDGKLLFGTDFLAPLSPSPAPPLRAFAIGADGALSSAPGTPMAIPAVAGGMPEGTPAALGLALHPTANVLYVGFVLRSQIGVYTYAANGSLTYVTNAPLTGKAPCWVRANPAGTRLYATDTATNSVSVLDATNAMAPTEIQHLVLSDPGPLYAAMPGAAATSPTSQTYQESLSADGTFLYVVSQRTNPDPTVTEGNRLHSLAVGADGKLTETLASIALPVTATARAQGVVAF